MIAGHCPLPNQGSPNNMRRRKSLPTVPVFNRYKKSASNDRFSKKRASMKMVTAKNVEISKNRLFSHY